MLKLMFFGVVPVRESESERARLFIITVYPYTLAFSNPCGFEWVRLRSVTFFGTNDQF